MLLLWCDQLGAGRARRPGRAVRRSSGGGPAVSGPGAAPGTEGFEARLAASMRRHRAILGRLGSQGQRPLTKAFRATALYRARPVLCEMLASRGWAGETYNWGGRPTGRLNSQAALRGVRADLSLAHSTTADARDLEVSAGPVHEDGDVHLEDSWSARMSGSRPTPPSSPGWRPRSPPDRRHAAILHRFRVLRSCEAATRGARGTRQSLPTWTPPGSVSPRCTWS